MQTKTANGSLVEGVYIKVMNWKAVRPTEISFHMMQLSAKWEKPNPFAHAKNINLFNKHVGNSAWWTEISQRGSKARVNQFVGRWESQSKAFQKNSRRFYLYK